MGEGRVRDAPAMARSRGDSIHLEFRPSGLNSRSPYPGHRNYSCRREGFFWHTKRMFSASAGVAVRARIALEVFLRLTRMDVCCGPPACR